MNALSKWRLFPRSLRQLVVMAFWLVLLPLLVLAYQAYQSLEQLSNQAAQINKTTLLDTRRSEAMGGLALEMERSYRQYCVLKDESLHTLYLKQFLIISKCSNGKKPFCQKKQIHPHLPRHSMN